MQAELARGRRKLIKVQRLATVASGKLPRGGQAISFLVGGREHHHGQVLGAIRPANRGQDVASAEPRKIEIQEHHRGQSARVSVCVSA